MWSVHRFIESFALGLIEKYGVNLIKFSDRNTHRRNCIRQYPLHRVNRMYNSHKYVVRILFKFADALHMYKWIERHYLWVQRMQIPDALHMYKWIERFEYVYLDGDGKDALHMYKWIERFESLTFFLRRKMHYICISELREAKTPWLFPNQWCITYV